MSREAAAQDKPHLTLPLFLCCEAAVVLREDSSCCTESGFHLLPLTVYTFSNGGKNNSESDSDGLAGCLDSTAVLDIWYAEGITALLPRIRTCDKCYRKVSKLSLSGIGFMLCEGGVITNTSYRRLPWCSCEELMKYVTFKEKQITSRSRAR